MKRFSEEYVVRAFTRIEEELIASMMRNLEHHQVEQIKEGMEWERWQVIQLAELQTYTNQLKTYGARFEEINGVVDRIIEDAYDLGLSRFERLRLKLSRMGLSAMRGARSFFGLPTERMDALVNATRVDLTRAEYAVLRQARDVYRKVIFDAQAYAVSGASNYKQAIDMATQDFLRRGIRGITYRNGSRHSIREYAQMAVRTAAKRAALVSEGKMRQEWGIHTIFINPRIDACPECMMWMGQVLVDDVYSGGSRQEAQEKGYALLSEAMAAGLFHPNCRDSASTYYEGITKLPPKPTRADIRRAIEREVLEGDISNEKARKRSYARERRFSLDSETKRRAKTREEATRERLKELEEAFSDYL